MKNLLLIIAISISSFGFSQTNLGKPTSVSLEMGGAHGTYSFMFNRVYAIQDKVAFAYEMGASPFGNTDEIGEFNPTVSLGWNALLFNRRNSHIEMGLTAVINEEYLTAHIAYRYQNFRNPGLWLRFSIIPVYADGKGIGTANYPGFGVGYSF